MWFYFQFRRGISLVPAPVNMADNNGGCFPNPNVSLGHFCDCNVYFDVLEKTQV